MIKKIYYSLLCTLAVLVGCQKDDTGTTAAETSTVYDITMTSAVVGCQFFHVPDSYECGIMITSGSNAPLYFVAEDASATSVQATGLEAATYYAAYTFVKDKSSNYTYGNKQIFVTLAEPIYAYTDIDDAGVTVLTTTSVIVNCSYANLNTTSVYGVMVESASGEDYFEFTDSVQGSYTIEGLKAYTDYTYCAYVLDNGEYTYGEVKTFNTTPVPVPTTGEFVYARNTLALVRYDKLNVPDGGELGVKFRKAGSSDAYSKSVITDTRTVAVYLEGLTRNTEYEYCTYILSGSDEYTGSVLTFTTDDSEPTTASYSIGDYYPNYENAVGIVVYLEPGDNTRGKISSYDQIGTLYGKLMLDGSNYEYLGCDDWYDGDVNTMKYRTFDPECASSASFLRACGRTPYWYLPACYELDLLREHYQYLADAYTNDYDHLTALHQAICPGEDQVKTVALTLKAVSSTEYDKDYYYYYDFTLQEGGLRDKLTTSTTTRLFAKFPFE